MKTTLGVVVVLVGAVAGPAAWAGTVQITGTIFDEATRLPLSGMCAEAYAAVATGEEFESAPTGPDGTYTISGLDPDTFAVVAYDCEPPVEHALVEYKRRRRSLHGGHSSLDGAHLIRLRRDGQVKKHVDFAVPVAGHITVAVVHDATGLPAPGVIIQPIVAPQPLRGSTVLSGFAATADANGLLTLDVDPGGSTLYAVFSGSSYVVGPVVTVDGGAVQPAEVRVP